VAVDSFGTLWQADNDDDGNRGVRFNYVMEYGNYGYVDEMTGAGWREKRTNLEADIPHRHWHQNDPGVIPNLLFTGAGAPTGMLIYEGQLQALRNQIILADAGMRVVRAVSVKPDGAGYQAEHSDLLSSADSWFRPSDVCVAPDGSIYVADWNDAVVGGHDMADHELAAMTGRIYRLAPPGVKPTVPKLNLKTAEGGVKALQSPNLSTRHQAWMALKEMPDRGRKELSKLWKDEADPRMRARALFLLAQEKGQADKLVKMALKEKNSDLRITGLRIAVEAGLNVIPYLQTLVNDPSPQVRRECAIALRHNPSPEAARLWAALARQHDGKDRWYVESLGIGADRQENKFFDAWLAQTGADGWDTAAGHDIIWRVRAAGAPRLLAKMILAPGVPAAERFRYFRAFDFINGPAKTEALITLATADDSIRSDTMDFSPFLIEAMSRLKGVDMGTNPALQAVLVKLLHSTRGTPRFVRLVEDFQLPGQNSGLLEVALKNPSDDSGIEAARMILASHDFALLENAMRETNSAAKLVEPIGKTRDKNSLPLLLPLITDARYDAATRREAVRSLGQIREGAAQLLQLAEEDKLPNDAKFTATMELNRVRWPDLKTRAAHVLPMPKGRNAETLPPVADLLKMKGDTARGAQVFIRPEVNCIGCHRVGDKGVDLGPALSEIGAKLGKDAIYEAILEPSSGIAFGYEAWRLGLKSGDDASGIIVSETAEELTLKDAKAVVSHIKKQDITTRQQLKLSLMPAGLQQALSTQELVDLVEYLASCKKWPASLN